MRCEDFPCCGHEAGCCPDFDGAGRQLNMRCTCGAVLPVDARFSICDTCMGVDDGDIMREYDDFDDEPDHGEQLENEEFERADEYYGHYQEDSHLEDFGDWGYEGMHEE